MLFENYSKFFLKIPFHYPQISYQGLPSFSQLPYPCWGISKFLLRLELKSCVYYKNLTDLS
uniref:Uncharacterized protein n=1 Tax=Piliocolobus tephrosceles TaxID=591936 RepID=A0A8C9GWC6_9PRIM